LQLNAIAILVADSTAFWFSLGSEPGNPIQTGQML